MAAAIGVCIAAIYYIMTLRASNRNRRIELTTHLLESVTSEDGWRRWSELMYIEWNDYHDFQMKYGSDHNRDNYVKRLTLWWTYDALGNLLKSGLADKESLYNTGGIGATWAWEKYQTVIEEDRRRYIGKDGYIGWEYLAKEMLKLKNQRDPTFKVPETFAKYIPDK